MSVSLRQELKLKEAREQHVLKAMEYMVRLVERPGLKQHYSTLFNESLLVQQRATFRLPASSDTHWRHGWFYDPCADQEPNISAQSKKAVETTPPQPDAPVAKMFFEAALGIAKNNDILIAANARSQGASKTLLGPLAKAAHTDSLMLIYKEYPGKGRQKLTETVHSAYSQSFGLQPARARLHYQLTTTTSDAIVQVLDMEEPRKVEVQEKKAILGTEQMTSAEKMMAPKDRVVLLHWEKRQEVYEEIFHHFQLTSLTTASVGRLQMLQACIKMGIKVLGLCRNEAHLKLVKADLLEWMFHESLNNPHSHFYLPRRALIEQLGLEPDEDCQLAGMDDKSSEGEPEVPEEEQPEEEQQEEQSEEEQQDEDEENPEEGAEEDANPDEEQEQEEMEFETGEPPKKMPKPKAKGKAKGKAKSKAKAEPKPKAKSKAKAEPKAKGKGKAKAKAAAGGEQAEL